MPTKLDNKGKFAIEASNKWGEWNALLDMAQEDLRQCND